MRDFFRQPTHPYSEALLKAVSITRQPGRRLLPGTAPSIYDLPRGCALSPRCPLVQPICRESMPALLEVKSGHFVRCHVRAPGSG